MLIISSCCKPLLVCSKWHLPVLLDLINVISHDLCGAKTRCQALLLHIWQLPEYAAAMPDSVSWHHTMCTQLDCPQVMYYALLKTAIIPQEFMLVQAHHC